MWYQAKISYQRENEAGLLVTHQEVYLVDAVSYTEAEARLHEALQEHVRDFTVKSISRYKMAQLVPYTFKEERWYRVKCCLVQLDDRTGKEKRQTIHLLVEANDINQAIKIATDETNNWLIPLDFTEVSLTPIVAVFPYEKEDNNATAN